MKRRNKWLWLVMVTAAAGCAGENDEIDEGRETSAQAAVDLPACTPSGSDASVDTDAGAPSDAGSHADAGTQAGSACASLTYDTFGKAFMQQYCATCHQGAAAPGRVDLTTLANVVKNKREIDAHAVKTPRSKPMPPPTSPQPSAADRAKLGQWLTCGPK